MKIRYFVCLFTLLSLGSCQLADLFTPKPVPATSLTLSDGTTSGLTTTTLALKGSKTIVAVVLPADSTDKPVWSSSDSKSVSVSQDGIVTLLVAPISPVTITAQAGSQTASFTVVLSATPSVTLTYSTNNGSTYVAIPANTHLGANGSNDVYLQAAVLPANTKVVWTSNSSLATIGKATTTYSSSGLISRVIVHCDASLGTATITATSGKVKSTTTVQPAGG